MWELVCEAKERFLWMGLGSQDTVLREPGLRRKGSGPSPPTVWELQIG